jgi:hypothetical protein
MVRLEFALDPEWFVFGSDDHEEYHLNPESGQYISLLTHHAIDQAIVDQLKEQYKGYAIGDFVYEDHDGYITKKLNRMTTHIGLVDLAANLIGETFQPEWKLVRFGCQLINLQYKEIKLHGKSFCIVVVVEDDHLKFIVSEDAIYVRELFTICRLYDN